MVIVLIKFVDHSVGGGGELKLGEGGGESQCAPPLYTSLHVYKV